MHHYDGSPNEKTGLGTIYAGMGGEVILRLWKRFLSELWGFFALSGLLALHTGILLTVYAIKDVTSHKNVVQAMGIVLIILGMIGILFSWFFHRQQREKRPLCRWGRYICPCCKCCESLSLGDDGSTRGSGRRNRESSSMSVFSTPEFRNLALRYSAFIKDETEGVENLPEETHESARLQKTSDELESLASPSITNSSRGSLSHNCGHNFIRVVSRNDKKEFQPEVSRDPKKSHASIDI